MEILTHTSPLINFTHFYVNLIARDASRKPAFISIQSQPVSHEISVVIASQEIKDFLCLSGNIT